MVGDGEGVLKDGNETTKERRGGRPSDAKKARAKKLRLTLFDLISFMIPAATQFFSPRSPLEASAAFFSSLTTRSPIVSGATGVS